MIFAERKIYLYFPTTLDFDIEKNVISLCSNLVRVIREGTKSPFLMVMISEGRIRALAEEKLAETDSYLVEVRVNPRNQIKVFIDNQDGVSINQCVQVSRHIEGNLDREVEDFELEVSSAGLDQPFKVVQQYLKYVSKNVSVVTKEGVKLTGKLLMADDEGFEIEEKPKKKEEPKKVNFKYDDVKETKVVISFK